jgi:hypothetical protein
MATIQRQYTDEIQRHLGFLATWPPNDSVRLGDVGRLNARVFERTSTLDAERIRFAVRVANNESSYEYVSENAVTLQAKAAGDAPTPGSFLSLAEAGVSIRFNRDNAIVFQAAKCVVRSIENESDVGMEILARYDRGDWERDWVVVTGLVRSDAASVLISSGGTAQLDLATSADLAAAGVVNLASLTADVRVVHSSNVGTRFIAAEGLTPLFRASGIRRTLFGSPSFTRRGEQPSAGRVLAGASVSWDSITYDDFE